MKALALHWHRPVDANHYHVFSEHFIKATGALYIAFCGVCMYNGQLQRAVNYSSVGEHPGEHECPKCWQILKDEIRNNRPEETIKDDRLT